MVSKTFAVRISENDSDQDIEQKISKLRSQVEQYRKDLAVESYDITVNDYFLSGIREFVDKHSVGVVFFNGDGECEMDDEEMCFVEIEFDFPASSNIENFDKFCEALVMLANADYPGDWEFQEYNYMDETSPGTRGNNLTITLHRNY